MTRKVRVNPIPQPGRGRESDASAGSFSDTIVFVAGIIVVFAAFAVVSIPFVLLEKHESRLDALEAKVFREEGAK